MIDEPPLVAAEHNVRSEWEPHDAADLRLLVDTAGWSATLLEI